MLIKDAMSDHVEGIPPNATVRECARKMDQLGVGALPVFENGQVVGMVADRDVCCRAIAGGKDPAKATARDMMTGNVASCFEDQDCAQAAHVMQDKHVRRVTIMNRAHAVVGVFSVDDLARYSHDLAGQVLEAAAPWPH